MRPAIARRSTGVLPNAQQPAVRRASCQRPMAEGLPVRSHVPGGGARRPSPAVERRDAFRLAVRRERDLLDAHLRVPEQFLAALLQRFAALVEPDRIRRAKRRLFPAGRRCLRVRPAPSRTASPRCPGASVKTPSASRTALNRAGPKSDTASSAYRSAASRRRTYWRTRPRSRRTYRCCSTRGPRRGGSRCRRAAARARRARATGSPSRDGACSRPRSWLAM